MQLIADVVKVAAFAVRPGAAQFTRCNRYLVCIGPDDRFQGGRRGGRGVRIDIAGRWQRKLPGQSVLAPIIRAPQLAHRLITDDRKRGTRQVRAVLDDRLTRAVAAQAGVTETPRPELHVEVQHQRVAGLERLRQRVDMVPEHIVGDHVCKRAIGRLQAQRRCTRARPCARQAASWRPPRIRAPARRAHFAK